MNDARGSRTDPAGSARFERWLRDHDPLPAPALLETEIEGALRRTREAWARAGAAGGRPGAAAAFARPAGAAAASDTSSAAAPGIVAAFSREPAPWGTIHVAASGEGLVAVELVAETDEFVAGLSRRLGGTVVADGEGVPGTIRAALAEARRELGEYFAGRRTRFEVPVDLRGVSAWDRLVLAGARRLAYGEVTSYGALARVVGRPGAARAVGGALGRNPVPVVIPCHRILAADGTLGGYGGGGHAPRAQMLDVKRWLLRLEDAAVRG